MLAPMPSSNSTDSLSQEIAELKLLIKQLTSRVTRLEMSSRQAEKSKATTTMIANAPTTRPPVSTSIPQRSYATTAAAAASQPETPWTTIHKKSRTPATAPPSNTTPLPTKAQRRIVITRSSKVAPKVDNLIMRNTINNALTKANAPKHVLILSVTYNSQGNMILTTKEGCVAEEILAYKFSVDQAIGTLDAEVTSIRKDTKWAKVIVHGISTVTYKDSQQGMADLKHEIETFNSLATLVTAPRWLASSQSREGKAYSSVVISVATREEASTLMKKGITVDGRKTKTEPYIATRPTDQCSNCQGFSHHTTRCSQSPKCCFCAGSHQTRIHACKVCNTSGKACQHTVLKCTNCEGTHKASDPSCEMIKAIRNPKPSI